ncbi:ATP-dependent RNA helicase dbp4 [Gurleya vavrai]
MSTFNEFNLNSKLLSNLTKQNYKIPTQIQSLVIPEAISGISLLAFSKTGSGKTLSFLVPVLQILLDLRWQKSDGLGAVILAPTRELALQIYEMLQHINSFFSSSLLIGGFDFKEITSQIVIATPGRLLEVLENGYYQARIVVIDEVDRMCEMGFKEDVEAILDYLSGEKQILRFSATYNSKILNEEIDFEKKNEISDVKSKKIIFDESSDNENFRNSNDKNKVIKEAEPS